MGVLAPEAGDFLPQPIVGLRHEIVIAAMPELVAVQKVALHPVAGRFDHVFAERLGVDRRQFAMPEDDRARVGSLHGTRLQQERLPSSGASRLWHAARVALLSQQRPTVTCRMRQPPRVTALAVIANQDAMEAHIDAAVTRILQRLPRGL